MSYADDANLFGLDATEPFTLEDCVKSIAKDHRYTTRRGNLAAPALVNHPNVFEAGDGRYVPRHHLFAGARFRIAPHQAEIEQGILFPGHRFMPFCALDSDADDYVILDEDSVAITFKPVNSSFDNIGIYYSLMPLQDIPFVAAPDLTESPPTVTLNALDMGPWFAKHDFEQGDTIVATVIDLEEGIYRFAYSPLEEFQKSFAQIRRSDIAIEEALAIVAEDVLPGVTIETQLFQAYAQVDPYVLQNPGRNLGAVLSDSSMVTWTNDGSICTLHDPDADPHQQLLLNTASVSQPPSGKGNTVEDILADLGVAVDETEIRAMILDVLHPLDSDQRLDEQDAKLDVLAEILPYGGVFVTDRQEQAFFEDFDRLWRNLADAEAQEPSPLPLATMRHSILDVKTRIRRLLRDLDMAGIPLNQLPPTPMIELSQVDNMMTDMLYAIEHDETATESSGQFVELIDLVHSKVDSLLDSVRNELGLQ